MGDIRDRVFQLRNISEEQRRIEVAFDVRLFEGDDFGAEQVSEVEVFGISIDQAYHITINKTPSQRPEASGYLHVLTISNASNGLSVPEHTVATRSGLSSVSI